MDKPIQYFADRLEEFLAKWGKRLSDGLWREYKARPRGFRALLGRKQAGILDDDDLWREMVEEGYALAFGFINEAAYAGYAAGEEMLLNIGMMVDFDAVNPAIAEMVLRNAFDLVRIDGPESIVYATREQLRRLMARMYAMPDVEMDNFMAVLEHLFGRIRAEMIAVTEMTRAYADSTVETGKRAPIRVGYQVSTVRDPNVCTICNEAEMEGPFPLEDTEHKPPLHPRCRCDVVLVPLES